MPKNKRKSPAADKNIIWTHFEDLAKGDQEKIQDYWRDDRNPQRLMWPVKDGTWTGLRDLGRLAPRRRKSPDRTPDMKKAAAA